MPRILISYRRGDTSAYAGRLYDGLAARFGNQQVFMDISALQPGVDFVAEIERAVATCDTVLVVIGRGWLNATDAQGRRRLEKPEDFVRLEVVAALSRGARVVPVLVDGAIMPTSEELPERLRDLARHNAVELSDSRWQYDLSRLTGALDSEAAPVRRVTGALGEVTPRMAMVLAAWGVAAGLAEALYFIPRVDVADSQVSIGWLIGGLVASTAMVWADLHGQWQWRSVLPIVGATVVAAWCDAIVFPLREISDTPDLVAAITTGGTLSAALCGAAAGLAVVLLSSGAARVQWILALLAAIGSAIGLSVQWQFGWGPLVWLAGLAALAVWQIQVRSSARQPLSATTGSVT